MIAVLHAALAVAGLPVLAASLYLLGLTVLSWRAVLGPAAGPTDTRFCVLVPAHNEARGLPATLASLRALDYPTDRRAIVVVADNCDDDTAGVAAAGGAHVIVRRDAERRGKGWALQYAIDRLLEPGAPIAWDALVVVDADTVVSPHLLRAAAARLAAGAAAVQAAYLPKRGDDGATAVITEVAFAAFHLVRSSARERLGLSCGLRGNGMAFSRDLLRAVPHTAFSRAEDLEFGVLLGLRGIRVAFAGDAVVYGDMPARADVVARQRDRWIGGRMGLARRFVPALVATAVRHRSRIAADLACDLLVPPVSLLAVLSIAGLALAAGLWLAGAGSGALAVWVAAAAALAIHVAEGARVSGRGVAFVRAAASLPGYAVGKAVIALRSLRRSDGVWVRTARDGDPSSTL